MDGGCTKMLLVSANVGSIFEDPEQMLQMWLSEFLSTVEELRPGFLAIHCQEVGGKNYEESMQHVNSFCKSLLTATEMQPYDRARFFLDEDFTAVEQFTALGNLYFVHQSVKNVSIFDFQESQFVPLEGREVLSGNIQNVPIKEKSKFPQEFFPDFKWSRKGFIRTRWNIQDSVLDLVNIHMFHDASNITAMETSPSQYSKNRERTLHHTLNRFENDQYDKVPLFIFGDFNFRLDSCNLIKQLTKDCSCQQHKGKKNDVCKCVFTQQQHDKVVLTIEKKGFDHHQHKETFSNNNKWLQQFDREPRAFSEKLHELDITFPPSYPFSEDVKDGTSYMKTRCPSWCDRILFTPDARKLMVTDGGLPEYGMIGKSICMGDHKPITLNLKLRHSNKGNIITTADPTAPSTPHSVSLPTSTDPSEPLSACVNDKSSPEHQNSPPPSPSPPIVHNKQPIKKVISINGEEVEVSSLHDFNIHDFASFEDEEHLTRKFMSTIRRKNSGGDDLDRKSSFKNVVKDVMQAERIMRALRHYSHRSDSEHEDTEDESAKLTSTTEELDKSQDVNANVRGKEDPTKDSEKSNVNIGQVKNSAKNTDESSNLAPCVNNNVELSDLNSPNDSISDRVLSARSNNNNLNEIPTDSNSPATTAASSDLLPDNNNLSQKKNTQDIDDVTISLTNEKVTVSSSKRRDSPKELSLSAAEKKPGNHQRSTKCHKCCVVM